MLANQVGAGSLQIIEKEKPVEIAKRALRENKSDVLIIDTAGRLQIDEALMEELAQLKKILGPTEILLTVDAMAGQESLNVARTFNERIGITGLVMTRADGDARGGAVLSMKVETGAPVLWVGTGEKMDTLSQFHADRVASQILGMGDVVSLVEKASEHISEKDAENMMTKMFSGDFDLNDMMKQIKQIKKMGSIGGLLKLIPGMSQIAGALKDKATDEAVNKQLAILQSMTATERTKPEIIFAARKERIARGSGTSVRDVEALLKNYEKMRTQMRAMSKFGSPQQLMEMMKNANN
jgi:signal recognition particle subunit SRP54